MSDKIQQIGEILKNTFNYKPKQPEPKKKKALDELVKEIKNPTSLEKTQQAYQKIAQMERYFLKQEKIKQFKETLAASGLTFDDYKKAKNFNFYQFYYLKNGKSKHSKFIIQKVRKWWKETRKEKPFLVLFGERGTGKTQLAKKIAIAAITSKEQLNVYYTDKKHIDKRIYDFDSKEEFLDFLMEVRFLIIDDLLSGHTSEFSFAQIYTVLDYRYQQGKLTLLTMNEDIRKYREENKYEDINLLADRLEEVAEFVHFDYPSLRSRKFLEFAKKGDIRPLQNASKANNLNP